MPKLEPIEGIPSLFIHPKTKRIYLRASFPGIGQKTVSTGTKNLKKAMLRAKDIQAEYYRLDPGYEPHSVSEVILEVLRINKGPGEKKWGEDTYKNNLGIAENILIPVFGDIPVSKFRETHWEDYCDVFYAKNKDGKLFNARKLLGKALRFAKRKGWMKEEFQLPTRDTESREGRVIPDKTLEQIIGAAKQFNDGPRKNVFRLQVYLGRYMGMRKDEVLSLTKSEIDLKTKTIHLAMSDTRTKKHKRDMGIAPEVLPILVEHLKSVDGIYLFPAQRGVSGRMRDLHTTWDRACDKVGVDFNFHDTRHTFGTIKVHEEKCPVADVAAYMGDSIRTVELAYLHPTAEQTRHVVDGPKLRVVQGGKVKDLGNTRKQG